MFSIASFLLIHAALLDLSYIVFFVISGDHNNDAELQRFITTCATAGRNAKVSPGGAVPPHFVKISTPPKFQRRVKTGGTPPKPSTTKPQGPSPAERARRRDKVRAENAPASANKGKSDAQNVEFVEEGDFADSDGDSEAESDETIEL
eukprot:GHVT01087326.1.p2 GENE.GHVT01087326.1~~GHVT01087326.1.p2  ORF type:complete len:148 (+),score=25.99 GHVT01087326.1:1357-1800(+)